MKDYFKLFVEITFLLYLPVFAFFLFLTEGNVMNTWRSMSWGAMIINVIAILFLVKSFAFSLSAFFVGFRIVFFHLLLCCFVWIYGLFGPVAYFCYYWRLSVAVSLYIIPINVVASILLFYFAGIYHDSLQKRALYKKYAYDQKKQKSEKWLAYSSTNSLCSYIAGYSRAMCLSLWAVWECMEYRFIDK